MGIAKTIVISSTILLSVLVMRSAWVNTYKNKKETISSTGLAKQDFIADLIVWNASFSKTAKTTKDAYAQLKKDSELMKKYLLNKHISEKEIVFSSISINQKYDTKWNKDGSEQQVFVGYQLIQEVRIESKEVDKIEEVSRTITELIDSGIELYSGIPEYYYTKLAELKIKMIADATKDGYTRAAKIAENANADLGNLKHAEMGIFQITAQNSSEDYTWGGTYNTASKRKTATITVRLEFSIN